MNRRFSQPSIGFPNHALSSFLSQHKIFPTIFSCFPIGKKGFFNHLQVSPVNIRFSQPSTSFPSEQKVSHLLWGYLISPSNISKVFKWSPSVSTLFGQVHAHCISSSRRRLLGGLLVTR